MHIYQRIQPLDASPMVKEYLNQDICQEIHTVWIIPEDVTVDHGSSRGLDAVDFDAFDFALL